MILAVTTDRRINTGGFSVAFRFCIHVNMGSGFLLTSQLDYSRHWRPAWVQRRRLLSAWVAQWQRNEILIRRMQISGFFWMLVRRVDTEIFGVASAQAEKALCVQLSNALKCVRPLISWSYFMYCCCRRGLWRRFSCSFATACCDPFARVSSRASVKGQHWDDRLRGGGCCSAMVTGWKGSADVICPQWLFGKSNCGDTGGSIVWIFCLEWPVCVVLRGGQEI